MSPKNLYGETGRMLPEPERTWEQENGTVEDSARGERRDG